MQQESNKVESAVKLSAVRDPLINLQIRSSDESLAHASGIDLKDIQSVPAFAPGVIGLQPIIEPGGIFHYTSCAVIKTKEGGMDGTFLMMNLTTNEKFVAVVAPFKLTPL